MLWKRSGASAPFELEAFVDTSFDNLRVGPIQHLANKANCWVPAKCRVQLSVGQVDEETAALEEPDESIAQSAVHPSQSIPTPTLRSAGTKGRVVIEGTHPAVSLRGLKKGPEMTMECVLFTPKTSHCRVLEGTRQSMTISCLLIVVTSRAGGHGLLCLLTGHPCFSGHLR